jgi:hypothetical protein
MAPITAEDVVYGQFLLALVEQFLKYGAVAAAAASVNVVSKAALQDPAVML